MTTSPTRFARPTPPAEAPQRTGHPVSAGPPREALAQPPEPAVRPPRSDMQDEPTSRAQRILVGVFVAVPLAALVAAIPLLWGWAWAGMTC